MKISVSTLGLYPAKITDVLNFISDNNIKYLEIVDEYPYDKITGDDISSYDIGLSIHSPLSDINIASHIDTLRKASIYTIIESFKKANDLGAESVVVHPGSISKMALKYPEKILEYNLDSLIRLQNEAENYGINMCVENMPLVDSLLYSNLEALFNDVKTSIHSSITLDVGHAHNNGYTSEEMFESDDIKHVHLSDNDASYDMHDALGTHNIDFPQIFEILNKKNYNDICVIEVNTKLEILKSIDYLKSINIL